VADLLTLEVATPTGLKLRTECDSVEAPSVQGQFGVLPNHLPLLAALRAGILRYHAEGKEHVVAIGHGFVEAEPERVLLLTDVFSLPEDIEVETVHEELREAEEELSKFPELYEGPDYLEIQRKIDWAEARLTCVELAER